MKKFWKLAVAQRWLVYTSIGIILTLVDIRIANHDSILTGAVMMALMAVLTKENK